MPEITIRTARFPADIEAIRALIGEYISGIDLNACRDEVAAGLRGLPAPYDAAGNGYLMAEIDGSPAGGCAFARLDADTAELARLFVRPEYRRSGIARALMTRAIEEAAARGYRRLVLHTLPEWRAARALYEDMAFEQIAAYPGVAVTQALCFAREL
jgi:putative acetyltransferase